LSLSLSRMQTFSLSLTRFQCYIDTTGVEGQGGESTIAIPCLHWLRHCRERMKEEASLHKSPWMCKCHCCAFQQENRNPKCYKFLSLFTAAVLILTQYSPTLSLSLSQFWYFTGMTKMLYLPIYLAMYYDKLCTVK